MLLWNLFIPSLLGVRGWIDPIGDLPKVEGFKVQSYYHPLSASNSISFHLKLEWQYKFLPKVVFFSWVVTLGMILSTVFFSWAVALRMILSTDNLRKRGTIVLDWFCMCKRCGELVDHPLLHCPIDYELWKMEFFRSFRLQ